MLTQLYIENFVLVEQLTIDFKPGLNIFTGETGAGKTIIISALNAVLGERVTTDLIRTGAERAIITGLFTVDNPSIPEMLKEAGITYDGDELLLQREIQQSGKHICRINGRPVTLSMLILIGKSLIDIHGQHQHQSLLSPQVQLHLLDRYGGLLDIRSQVGEIYQQFMELTRELNRLSINETEKAKQISLLSFEIDEIDRTNLLPDEDNSITEEIHLLHHAQRLHLLAAESHETLYSSDGAIYPKLYQVLKNIQEIAGIDASMQNEVTEAEGCYYQIEALSFRLKEYAEKCCFDPIRLEECEARLNAINNLKRKYGQGIEDILTYRNKAEKQLKAINHQEEEVARIEAERQIVAGVLSQAATTLSHKRQESSAKLMYEIENELQELSMKNCQFLVDLKMVEEVGSRQSAVSRKETGEYLLLTVNCQLSTVNCKIFPHGFDEAQFLICPNIGEVPRPLADIASGGELSRIMLAIKGILARVDEIPTLVFDEIDTGVGGKTAQKVAEKLKHISQSHQVICITHLPMIASFADHHLHVEKTISQDRTTTLVRPLDQNERITEIACMLGGVSETSLMHAQELIKCSGGL
ncbi:MAG: DNA repair protein RecN [Candidatus Desantisbacteria bacterium]